MVALRRKARLGAPVRRLNLNYLRGYLGPIFLVLGLAFAAFSAPGAGVTPNLPGARLETGRGGVAATMIATIATPSHRVDPGVPFTLSARVVGGLGPYLYLWTNPILGDSHDANWTVVLPSATVTTFSLLVGDQLSNEVHVEANLSSGLPPVVRASSNATAVDSGTWLPISFDVEGGVPPYELNWSLLGLGSSQNVTVATPGALVEPVWVNRSGPAWIEVSIVDAVGGEYSFRGLLGSAAPPVQILVAVTPLPAEAGTNVSATALISGGSPPLRWRLLPVGPWAGGASESGALNATGLVRWTAQVPVLQNFSLQWVVVDSTGATFATLVAVPVVPAVNVILNITVGTGGTSGTVALSASIAGGIPPYAYAIWIDDGERCLGNLSNPGTVNWTAAPAGPGPVTVFARIVDAGGVAAGEQTTIRLAPPSGVTNPFGSGALVDDLLIVTVAVAALGVAAFLWVRRRPGASDSGPLIPATDPEAVVRAVLSGGRSVDRETLELQAEERGVDEPTLTSILDDLTERGIVEVEYGPDGERWKSVGSAGRSGGGPDGEPGPGARP